MSTRRSFLALWLAALVPWRRKPRNTAGFTINLKTGEITPWKEYLFPDYLLRTGSISGKSAHTTPAKLPWVRA